MVMGIYLQTATNIKPSSDEFLFSLVVKGLPRQATDVDGRLHIPQVTVGDSGEYVCTGLDTAAGAAPASVNLIVDDSCMSHLFIYLFTIKLGVCNNFSTVLWSANPTCR